MDVISYHVVPLFIAISVAASSQNPRENDRHPLRTNQVAMRCEIMSRPRSGRCQNREIYPLALPSIDRVGSECCSKHGKATKAVIDPGRLSDSKTETEDLLRVQPNIKKDPSLANLIYQRYLFPRSMETSRARAPLFVKQ
ncbi:hypothetical protein HN011_008611 [Eciton burchellii]|nr:hypothetical protein HN011_008611 [Eciton burchellii]